MKLLVSISLMSVLSAFADSANAVVCEQEPRWICGGPRYGMEFDWGVKGKTEKIARWNFLDNCRQAEKRECTVTKCKKFMTEQCYRTMSEYRRDTRLAEQRRVREKDEKKQLDRLCRKYPERCIYGY